MSLTETLGQVMQTRPILGYGAAYLGGVVATASPCILASIPLVIGFVGGYAGGNKKQAFIYSLTFVLGLAMVMSALGAMAALMGTMFGDVGTYWYFVVAVILMVMGLQLAGILNLKLGGNTQKFLPQRTGLIGALILGALLGLVLSPCASPVLAVILTLGRGPGQGSVRQHLALRLRPGSRHSGHPGRHLYRGDRELPAIQRGPVRDRYAKSGRRSHLLYGGLHFLPGDSLPVIRRYPNENIEKLI